MVLKDYVAHIGYVTNTHGFIAKQILEKLP